MSIVKTLKEYVELVKNGVRNGDKIIEAIRISAKIKEKKRRIDEGKIEDIGEISDEAVAEIMRRKEICASCPFNSKIAAERRNYNSSIPFEHCTLCQCRIGTDDSKEYCLSCDCGMKVWNERNPHLQPMELKWTAFKETSKTEQ